MNVVMGCFQANHWKLRGKGRNVTGHEGNFCGIRDRGEVEIEGVRDGKVEVQDKTRQDKTRQSKAR